MWGGGGGGIHPSCSLKDYLSLFFSPSGLTIGAFDLVGTSFVV